MGMEGNRGDIIENIEMEGNRTGNEDKTRVWKGIEGKLMVTQGQGRK